LDAGAALANSGAGFQWYRWAVQGKQPLELLYAVPNYFQEPRATRSGNPILFPFPNRIRGAQFIWAGKEYSLPPTDATGKHAIHGFVWRHPFRVVEQGADDTAAWVRAEFQASRDAPGEQSLWPADYVLRITYRYFGQRVRLEAEVFNPDNKDLPWGLGFHPYFSVAPFGGEEAVVGTPARQYWELAECLPLGTRQPVAGQRDLRAGKRVGDLHLDDVLTDLDLAPGDGGLPVVGWVKQVNGTRRLEVRADRSFREMVVFNPAHRQAVCLEPYTCVTDAVHLRERGLETGWQVLPPGKNWQGTVEFAFLE
jgi:aldose 1-epimerase